MRTTLAIATELGSYIPLAMFITWLDFGVDVLETLFFCQIFFENFGCVFSRSNTIGYISGMFGPIDVKWKGGASVGYWVNCVSPTFDLTPDLDLYFSRSNFKITVSQELLSDWYETKGKQINYIMGWLYNIIFPFDHTYDLDHVVSR